MKSKITEKLDRLWGKPYRERLVPENVPCIETSDSERLCKNPLVSVQMLAYNHERYIRQAIEGVMMQKTDFEFELVIGEDASPDKTREICFEYQKKYPDKIRVLWSEHNEYATGGNETRVDAACRGKYIAFCEGDDFWTNPNKLQIQIDEFRANPELGMCLIGTDVYVEATGETRCFNPAVNVSGLLKKGARASAFALFNRSFLGRKMARSFYQTSGWMVDAKARQEIKSRYADIYALKLSFGDTLLLTAMAEWYDLVFIPESGSTYRINSGSVSFTRKYDLKRDLLAFRLYWLVKVRGWPFWLAKARYLLKIIKLRRKK